MLTIRMQRTGRKGLAHFRVVVQDSRFAPNSGRVVAQLGHHNPHTKETVLDKELTEKYLQNGAQPSERVVRLLMGEKITLPEWVDAPSTEHKRSVKNPEKLRKNQPKEEAPAEPEAESAPVAEEPEATEEVAASDEAKTEETEKPAQA